MRRGGPPSHPATTEQIVGLRDQGLTWKEVAEQVGMTVSGAWSRYQIARPPKSPRLGRWQQIHADALDQNLAIGVRTAVADHLGRAPTRAELTAARRAAHSLATRGRARVFQMPGADADDDAGDRNYLVLAKPNVIMNDIRLRGLAVARIRRREASRRASAGLTSGVVQWVRGGAEYHWERPNRRTRGPHRRGPGSCKSGELKNHDHENDDDQNTDDRSDDTVRSGNYPA
jgi:hypothetical protein